MCGAQVDLSVRPLKTLNLYKMLLDLMKNEEKSVQQIRGSMKEVTMVTSGGAVSKHTLSVLHTLLLL